MKNNEYKKLNVLFGIMITGRFARLNKKGIQHLLDYNNQITKDIVMNTVTIVMIDSDANIEVAYFGHDGKPLGSEFNLKFNMFE